MYCESQFGLVDGKTASALVRHSEIYTVVGIIDSSLAGEDAGEQLSGVRDGIPIFADLADALGELARTPDCYIYGKAPLEACISTAERLLVLEAMDEGMDIINGLHQFFSEDREFVLRATENDIKIVDIRKPPHLRDLHVFTGGIADVDVPVIAMLGTDCACGKGTTTIELNNALNARGIKSVLVATGQTTLMQGAAYGAPIDALVSQFVIGEIEDSVIKAFREERPDIILVEGQSSVSHPAFMSSIGILKGSMPDGVILQHPPSRTVRCDFPQLAMPTIESEIKLIEAIAPTKVVAVALSHEGMLDGEMAGVISEHERRLRLPTTDVLTYGCDKLVQALIERFPTLSTEAQPDVATTNPEPLSALTAV